MPRMILEAVTATIGCPSSRAIAFEGSGDERRWFAACTFANHEKRAAEHLAARAVEHFLPLYTSLRRWKDRRVLLELPLFPGYVFVRIEVAARVRVLEVPGVVRLVGSHGRPYALPEAEVENLRGAVLNASRIEPHPFLNVGSRVRIKRGPLAGVEGKLVRKKNRFRVVLSLDLIARSAAVEVDAEDLERI